MNEDIFNMLMKHVEENIPLIRFFKDTFSEEGFDEYSAEFAEYITPDIFEVPESDYDELINEIIFEESLGHGYALIYQVIEVSALRIKCIWKLLN